MNDSINRLKADLLHLHDYSTHRQIPWTDETPEGVLWSRENGVKNNQGARSSIQK